VNQAMIPSDRTAFGIGAWRIEPALDQITRGGVTAKLEPRTMRVLVCLAEHAGRVVSVEQLLDAVWKDVAVTQASVYQAVAGLRRALGDDQKNPIYIANVQRRGYRLIAPVVPVEHEQITATPHRESAPLVDGASAQPTEVIETARRSHDRLAAVQAPVEPGWRLASPGTNGAAVQPAGWSQRAIVATVVFVLLLLATTSAYVYLRRGGERAAGIPPAIHSLAVLPLENLSGDKGQEYFADGMTEELITNLAQIGSLRVISRTSAMHFKGSKETLPQIGRDLQVDAVVEGSVAHVENRVRVTAQLVEASTDHHLWARTYERDLKDILALQDEIAQDITEQIRVKLTPEEHEHSLLMQVHAVDPQAYDAYLRGRYWWNQTTPEEGMSAEGPSRAHASKALDYFQKAIAKDPSYALAYTGLADSFLQLGASGGLPLKEAYVKAGEAANEALRLDPSLAEVHTSLANVKFLYDWDWSGAEAEYKRAAALNPNYATAHRSYSFYLVAMGRLDEAMKEIERAQVLDPLSPSITFWLGQVLYHARRYDDALRQNRRGSEMFPENAEFYWAIADVYEQKKMFAEAFAARQQALSLGKDPNVTALGEAYKRSGYRGYLLKAAQILELADDPADAAHCYALLTDETRAVTALEEGYNKHLHAILFLRTAPELDSVRSSPRFRDLVRRIGFPQPSDDKN
jgi:TolB-like protein/DNA-binding winged helix-turn-helix (wHTH) protein/Flp pilus assembly protein TadD